MFCAKCGKEIDNDSTFCPYCGQETDAPVEKRGGIQKPKVSVKMPNKKVLGGIGVAVVAVLLVFGISRLIGGISNRSKSLSEKLFSMSWEERSELSEADLKSMLKESGTLYGLEEGNTTNIYQTKTTEPFMGGDCIYLNVPDVYASNYVVRYESEEDFKDGKKLIEDTLQKQLLKKADVYETDIRGAEAQYYLIGKTNKNLDQYLENVDFSAGNYTFESLNELFLDIITTDENYDEVIDMDKISEMKDQYSIYKFAYVFYSDEEPFGLAENFPSDKSYTDQNCIMGVIYVPAREEVLASMLAVEGSYDFISGKKIDTDEFKESVDEKMMGDYLDQYASDDRAYRREMENEAYIRLYMMEKHKLDIDQNVYLKTDEEKRLWYIHNFSWDTSTGAAIDLSDYRGSSEIYCAVECNYNSDISEYFESDLDKALYLAGKDYKLGSGRPFKNADEVRLWFMQNYSYDTSSEKMIDKEVVDALVAYQKYIDKDDEEFKNEYYGGYNLIYIDEDDVPELLATGTSEAAGHKIISYHNGRISENYIGRLWGLQYAEKKNFYCNSNGNMGNYYDAFYKLVEGEQTEIALGENGDKYDEEGKHVLDENGDFVQEYFWNGVACGSKEEYYNIINDFVKASVGEVKLRNDYSGERYFDILAAYDALRTTIYETNEYCIYEYELKDNILTVKADDGAKVSSSFGSYQPFEFSYPVADDCVWQGGGHGYGPDAQDGSWDVSPEDIESEINQVRELYDTEPDWIESPLGIQFRIIDDEVIAVYTSGA